MKQRGWPLWLLRDVPAFAAVMLSFWPLVIFLIVSGARPVRDGRARSDFHVRAAKLIASAECRLDHAFWREAYRRIGWKARLAPLNIVAPPEGAEGVARFRAYLAAFCDMESVVRSYVEHLRQQYRISACEIASHGAIDAPIHLAATIFVASSSCRASTRETQRAPARHGSGNYRSRGPPQRVSISRISNSQAHLRERTAVRA